MILIQLLLIYSTVCSSHVFLPKVKRTASRSDHKHAKSFIKLYRGGDADTSYFNDDVISEEEEEEEADINISMSPVANNNEVVLDSSPHSEISTVVSANDQTQTNDMMMYATIGILNVPTTTSNNDIDENSILVSYKNDANGKIVSERWGTTNHNNEKSISTTTTISDDELALAEVNGCLCHGIVLNIHQPIFDSNDGEYLDNVLLCISEGIIRRMKGTQQVTIPITITFGQDANPIDNDLAKDNAVNYIQEYIEQSISQLWKQMHSSSEVQCKVIVGFVDTDSALNAATEMANRLLENSVDEVMDQNIVPLSLFGILSKQVYTEIQKSRRVDKRNENIAEWKKLHEDSQDGHIEQENDKNGHADTPSIDKDLINTVQSHLPSADLKKRVESLMAMTFVDVEELLHELEEKMDSAFLDMIEDENIKEKDVPMSEFGSNADSIVSVISASFQTLLDQEEETITETDREWLNEQRLEVLKQVLSTGIHRLFHVHLQNLRDYYGQQYEYMLEENQMDNDDFGESSTQKDEKDWNVQRQEATRLAEEGFRKEAFGSVPQICQHPNGELSSEMSGKYSCVEALRGLLEDMYEITIARGLEQEEWKDTITPNVEDDISSISTTSFKSSSRVGLRQLIKNVKAKIQKRGPAKWYERWALKALVIGINYIQGWLVLQALRREARKRDRDMPKFPLF